MRVRLRQVAMDSFLEKGGSEEQFWRAVEEWWKAEDSLVHFFISGTGRMWDATSFHSEAALDPSDLFAIEISDGEEQWKPVGHFVMFTDPPSRWRTTLEGEDYLETEEEHAQRVYLDYLFVGRPYRKLGIAAAALHELRKVEMHRYGARQNICLNVFTTNLPAIASYEKIGFVAHHQDDWIVVPEGVDGLIPHTRCPRWWYIWYQPAQ